MAIFMELIDLNIYNIINYKPTKEIHSFKLVHFCAAFVETQNVSVYRGSRAAAIACTFS